MCRLFFASVLFFGVFFNAQLATAKAKNGYHCSIKKNGKTKDDFDVKTRKECKKKGGKWVKDHSDHGHDHDSEDHEHEEEDEK